MTETSLNSTYSSNYTSVNYRKFIQIRYIFYFLFLFYFISPIHLLAQRDLTCDYCGKIITGKYLETDGKYFHPKHFICAKCKRVISGPFTEKDNRFYHPDCYAAKEGMYCDYCKKLIRDEYITSEGKKYHQSCYEEHVVPKCVVCRKPLTGEYTIDAYGNKYHSYHNHELEKCDNCDRIISQATTGGGKTYSDGRHICNLCYSDPVFDNARFRSLLGKVMQRLKSFGLSFNERAISIKGVDRVELRREAGRRYDSNMRGFCQSSKETEYIGSRISKSTKKHIIYVLNGVPSLNEESVIAHELMHVWMNDNTSDNHPDDIREGSCNYMSFLYLRSIGSSQAKQIIKMLENDSDEVYGRGFLRIKSGFENKSLSQLLNYLKSSRS